MGGERERERERERDREIMFIPQNVLRLPKALGFNLWDSIFPVGISINTRVECQFNKVGIIIINVVTYNL